MAKKSKKKAARKPAAKPAKKAPKAPAGPETIKTGKGPGPREVGSRLVELCNAGRHKDVESELWSPKIVSIEGTGQAWHGRAAVDGKNQWWTSENEVLGMSAEGPYVGATGFAVKFRIQFRQRASGQVCDMTEVGVYTVLNGKIVQEEFMYGG